MGSSCSAAGVRSTQCTWQGDEANGKCCSKQANGKIVCAKDPGTAKDHYERENLLIGEIDLAPDDFNLKQLQSANARLRMECFYKAETDAEKIARIRRTKGLKKAKDATGNEAGKKDATGDEAGKKDATANKAGKKDATANKAGKKRRNWQRSRQKRRNWQGKGS